MLRKLVRMKKKDSKWQNEKGRRDKENIEPEYIRKHN